MRLRFTKEQSDLLGKLLYDSTKVTVVVNTSQDKVEELAIELNATPKRVKKWIANRKRWLKPELFKQAAFKACGIPGPTGESSIPAGSKPKITRKRECPGAPKRSVRFKPINRSDAVPKLLNFQDTGLPNLESETIEEMSLDDMWEPSNGEPSAKRIKTENQSSIGETAQQYDAIGKNSLIKQEGYSRTGDGFRMDMMDAESLEGIENSIFSTGMNFESIVNNNPPLSVGEHDESSKGLPNAVLFPTFLRGLPSNEPSTPKTPLSSIKPKLEIKRPFGRPPPCVGGVDEPTTLGYVQQSSFIKQPSKKLPRIKKNGNPGPRATATRARQKLTDNQQLILESFFIANLFTTKKIKEVVAESAGLTFKRVRIWIMNRKARERKGLPSHLPEIKPSTARGCSEIQRRLLVAFFNAGLLEEPNYREAIGKATGLTEKKIRIWRMNHRARLKKEGKLLCSET